MLDDKKSRTLIFQGKKEFGVKSKKFVGALTVEVLKNALREQNIPVSPRDVFIKGVSVEIDLLIPKRGSSPKYGLLYEPEDVLAALEVKELGSWGEQTLNQIRRNFELIHQIKSDIYCTYVTLTERKPFKWAITTENLGLPAYTLFWHKGDDIENGESSGDFGRLMSALRSVMSSKRVRGHETPHK
ncbi:MAG: hypothetical protein HY530_07355 [Chloroflexi bacterium]|nr:hypothetical protein [Chloroflexota bacterium]